MSRHVRRLKNIIHCQAGLISVHVSISNTVANVSIRSSRSTTCRSVRAGRLVLTYKRSTHSVFRLLGSRGITLTRGAFTVNIHVRRPRHSVSETRCKTSTKRPTLKTTPCGLITRLPGNHDIFSFYVYPNKRIITTSSRRNRLYIGNTDLGTHSKHGTGTTLLIGIAPRSLPGSSPLTNVRLRHTYRTTTCHLNNSG